MSKLTLPNSSFTHWTIRLTYSVNGGFRDCQTAMPYFCFWAKISVEREKAPSRGQLMSEERGRKRLTSRVDVAEVEDRVEDDFDWGGRRSGMGVSLAGDGGTSGIRLAHETW
jgi:hypothetical protein